MMKAEGLPLIAGCPTCVALTHTHTQISSLEISLCLVVVWMGLQCGEQLKRTSTYLDKSTGTSPIATLRGKHELDAAEIRSLLTAS